MALAVRLITTPRTMTTSGRPPWTSPDADPKETRGKRESQAFILLFSEVTVPNTIHGGGVGVGGRKVNYMSCCFPPSTPARGDVREGEKT